MISKIFYTTKHNGGLKRTISMYGKDSKLIHELECEHHPELENFMNDEDEIQEYCNMQNCIGEFKTFAEELIIVSLNINHASKED